MIVPGPGILRLFAATVLPATLALAVVSPGRPAIAAATLIYVVIVAGDALLAERRRRGIDTRFPDRIKLSRDREGVLPFTIINGSGGLRSVVIGLQLPAGLTSPCSLHPLRLSKAGDRDLQWPLTGRNRGSYLLETCRIRVLSPLGLWYGQGSLPAGTRVCVYPNLREERRRLAAIFLNRNDALIRPQRRVGQGKEFEKLRLYVPGDCIGDIHWKATARRGQLVTKEFQIERTQEVYVAIDASRLSARPGASCSGPSDGEPLLERYLRSALILGTVAQQQGDLFGVVSFGERVGSFVQARAGKAHFGACRDALFTLVSSRTNPGYADVASFLSTRLKRRALIIFLTSLDEPVLAEEFVRSIGVLSRRHLICVAMVRPPAAVPLFSDLQVDGEDDLYRSLGGHMIWHQLRELQQTLRLRGVQLALVADERLSIDLVSRYLDVKRRQML